MLRVTQVEIRSLDFYSSGSFFWTTLSSIPLCCCRVAGEQTGVRRLPVRRRASAHGSSAVHAGPGRRK
jgi:hypothetical protein